MAVVTSFATTYPEAFRAAKPGDYHFVNLRTPEAWNTQDGHQVDLHHDFSRGINEQKNALAAHARVQLQGYQVGLDLFLKTLSDTCDWLVWFASTFEGHAKMLFKKACQGESCTKEGREQCWHRAMGGLKAFFDELRHARVHAVWAELHSNRAHRNRTFLHCTLEELRVMKEFQYAELKRHKFQDGLLKHIYET